MGTRHLIAVVKDGTHKIAQYGQWDGYPDGQGATIVRFLRDKDNYFRLKGAVDNVHYAAEGEVDAILTETGNADLIGAQWVDMEQAARMNTALPGMSRDVGADILPLVADGLRGPLTDAWDFGEDGLFCEWAYVIDCDTDTLEVYAGGSAEPAGPGRWDNAPEGVRKVFEAPIASLITWTRESSNGLDEGFTKAFSRALN